MARKITDIYGNRRVRKEFRDADIDMLVGSYSSVELSDIISGTINDLIMYKDGVITYDELLSHKGRIRLFGIPKDKLTKKIIEHIKPVTGNRFMYYDFMVSMECDIEMMDKLYNGNHLLGELLYRLVNNIPLTPIQSLLDKCLYDRRIDTDNIYIYMPLFKYTIGRKNNTLTNITIEGNTHVTEMKKITFMYGIPYLGCSSLTIYNTYYDIKDGKIKFTLLGDVDVNMTSDITFDDYRRDDLLFLLWNNTKPRLYNLDDLLASSSEDDIRLVDSTGALVATPIKDMKACLLPYITDEMREYYANHDADPLDVYPKIIAILKILNTIETNMVIPEVIRTNPNTKEYANDMYDIALYFRRWKGPGHPIPYKAKDSENTDVLPEVTASHLISKYRTLLDNRDKELMRFIKACPRWVSTKDDTSGRLQTTFTESIRGTLCIRVASSSFLHTSIRILNTLYNAGIDAAKFENISLVAPEERTN